MRAAKDVFNRWRQTGKGIRFEHVKSNARLIPKYRYPPRLFTRRSLSELALKPERANFRLRYLNGDDKRFALRQLDKLDINIRAKRQAVYRGSHIPSFVYFYDIADAVRGMLKIGLNLIAAVTKRTPITPENFPFTIGQVLRDIPINEKFLNYNGFVRPDCLQPISVSGRTHFGCFILATIGRRICVSSAGALAERCRSLAPVTRIGEWST